MFLILFSSFKTRDKPTKKSDNESDPEEPLKCTFKWSKMSEKKYSNDKNTYLTPWDIDNNYKLRCADKKQSILKKTNKPGM